MKKIICIPLLVLGVATSCQAKSNPAIFTAGDYDQWRTTTGPVRDSWVNSVYKGIFNYIPANAALNAFAAPDTIGVSAPVRSSTGIGGANIGFASFALNDRISRGASNAWNYYGTAVRAPGGVDGSTISLEIDVANLGNIVPLTPSQPFQLGLTTGIQIAAGGEIPDLYGSGGISSAALVIASNDAGKHPPIAQWEKGIVFHNNAVLGADGSGGHGTAIAFAAGHQLNWYSNNNQVVGQIYSDNTDPQRATEFNLGRYGVVVSQHGDGGPLFQIQSMPGSKNYLSVKGAVEGASPQLQVNGSDSDINIEFSPKGHGDVEVHGDLVVDGVIRLKTTTVAKLPICNKALSGAMYAVSDAFSPTYNSAVSGGGSESIPVFCNGIKWVSH